MEVQHNQYKVGDIITTNEDGLDIKKGVYATITGIVSAEESEDGVGYYSIDSATVTNGALDFDKASFVMSAEDAKTKLALPTVDQLLEFISYNIHGEDSGIEIYGTEKDGDRHLLIDGKTEHQVKFYARITVGYIEEADF